MNDPQAYFDFSSSQGILLDPAERRQAIAAQIRRLLAEIGALDQVDDGLLDEVNQLVEAPTALAANLRKAICACPPRC